MCRRPRVVPRRLALLVADRGITTVGERSGTLRDPPWGIECISDVRHASCMSVVADGLSVQSDAMLELFVFGRHTEGRVRPATIRRREPVHRRALPGATAEPGSCQGGGGRWQ